MKKNLFLVLILFLLVGSFNFAEIPDNTIIIGSKAFTIDCLFDPSFSDDINNALAESGGSNLYFRMAGEDNFSDLMTGEPIDQSETQNWPEITLVNENREEVVYGAGNGVAKDKKEAVISLESGAISSFKKITVESTDLENVDKIKINSELYSIGEEVTTMISGSNILLIEFLDVDSNVLAELELDTSEDLNSESKTLSVTDSGDNNEEDEPLEVISIE